MNSATARLVSDLASRPAPARPFSSTPAPRRISRLDQAIVVKPPAPAPVSASKRRATPAVAEAPAPKVVRIPRDPAVAAAEAERKLQLRLAAGAEVARKAEEARVAAEAKAAEEHARQVEATRAAEAEALVRWQAAEAEERAQRLLQGARDAFLAVICRAPDAFFDRAWEGKYPRNWFEENVPRGDMDWIGKTRVVFDAAFVDFKQKVALAASEAKKDFEMFVEAIDLDVILYIRLGPDWNPRRTNRKELIGLARVGTSAAEMVNIRNAVAQAIALRDRARRDAEAELERQKLNPKSKHFDLRAYLEANRGKSIGLGGNPPSKARLAEIALKENAPKPKSLTGRSDPDRGDTYGKGVSMRPNLTVPAVQRKAAERELLDNRIRALDPKIVANVYRGNKGWRWQTVEEMLAVPASDKEANAGLAEFVTKCEVAKAKRERR